jgi:2-phosphosulfolactate phosphatase
VIPFEETEDAVRTARQFERGEVTLAGERHMVAIPGFDLGNSPLEFTPARVGKQTVMLTTTNGTKALLASGDAKTVLVASYANFSVTLTRLEQALNGGEDIAIVCASREGMPSLEDSACAGRFTHALRAAQPSLQVNDAAQLCELLSAEYGDDVLRLFGASEHGRALHEAGFDDDLHACAAVDLYPVLAEYRDRAIVARAVGAPAKGN